MIERGSLNLGFILSGIIAIVAGGVILSFINKASRKSKDENFKLKEMRSDDTKI